MCMHAFIKAWEDLSVACDNQYSLRETDSINNIEVKNKAELKFWDLGYCMF